jgi:16S rRNA (uracil1498-N3)-methyltransferase
MRDISKTAVTLSLTRIVDVPRPPLLEVIVPVADRDRMLLAAEKCAELQITAWRPVYFARSRSVTPRGEGSKFGQKVRARMQSALEQSGGAWLPDLYPEAEWRDAMTDVSSELQRFLLDQDGSPLAVRARGAAAAMAVGPEGGLESGEVAAALESGWVGVSLGPTTLRFETAVIAGAAVIRASQLSNGSS